MLPFAVRWRAAAESVRVNRGPMTRDQITEALLAPIPCLRE
jgi:hypothetical protein